MTIVAPPPTQGPATAGRERDLPSQPTGPRPVGLARERAALSARGLPPDVVATIQGTRAGSTRAAYDSKWNIFESWCLAQSPPLVAFVAPVRSILIFLQDRLNQGLTFSTVKMYLGVISGVYIPW